MENQTFQLLLYRDLSKEKILKRLVPERCVLHLESSCGEEYRAELISDTVEIAEMMKRFKRK